jgi:uncharacterized protein (TIGR03083 family)
MAKETPITVGLGDHIQAERSDFRGLLEELSEEEFNAPSLCEGWTVRDVAAHAISYDRISPLLYVPLFAVSGLSIDRTNRVLVRWWRRRGTGAIVEAFRRSPSPRRMMSLLGRRIALLDAFVHQQDIRRPLGRSREIPPERLVVVGDILRHHRIGAGGMKRAKGLRLQSDDIDWSAGDGPIVHGPAEALLMALAGRPAALDELAGEGKDQLAQRVAR